jgi:hypothetical protein
MRLWFYPRNGGCYNFPATYPIKQNRSMGVAAPRSTSLRWQDSNCANSRKWTSGGGDGSGLPGGTDAGPLCAADDGVAGALERSSVEGPPLGGVDEEQSWPEDCWPRVGLPGPEWEEPWWNPTEHSFGARLVRGFLDEPSSCLRGRSGFSFLQRTCSLMS